MRANLVLGFAAALLISGAAQAAAPVDPLHLTGPTRTAQLIAGAKREGSVSVYCSAPVEVTEAVAAAFQKAYGVKVDVWRGASEDILQRTLTEARAGRFTADVIETAGPEMEAANREKLLAEFTSPVFAELMPESVTKGRPWVMSRLTVFVTAYNTNLVRPADVPKRYEDFLLPKWKGKLGIEGDDANWLMALTAAMGEAKGLQLFRDIVAKNGMSVRKGHTALAQFVASGEVPLAIDAYIEHIAQLKKNGAPVEMSFLAPMIAMPTAVAIFKRAPHPYAAALFADFYLTEGEKILAAHDYVPANLKVQRLPAGVKLTIMDVGRFLDENAKWRKLHADIFAGR